MHRRRQARFAEFDRLRLRLRFQSLPMPSSTSSSTRSSSAPVLPSPPPSAGGGGGGGGFASYSSSITSRSPSIFNRRSTSPTRLNLVGTSHQTSSLRFSVDRRPTSPGRSIAFTDRSAVKKPISAPAARRTCTCSPTNHPGSFRCALHRNPSSAVSSPSNRLNMRRSAMTNSLVRIGTVEGDLVRRALAALIRPSSHQQKRRFDFQARPSRLSVISMAEDDI